MKTRFSLFALTIGLGLAFVLLWVLGGQTASSVAASNTADMIAVDALATEYSVCPSDSTYWPREHDAQGYVRYETTMDFAQTASHQLQSLDLVLNINYDHDWVEGGYPLGHTVWITVTDSGGNVKATAEMVTSEIPWWGGGTGFSTNYGYPWQPGRPNIQPGDFVYGATSPGYTASVEIGLITGSVDVDADSITGTVSAAWLMPGPVDIRCEPWGAPGAPNKHTSVTPDGIDTYICAWDPDTEWDVQPGQDIGVSYREPDGHRIYGVFRAPVYDLILHIYPFVGAHIWGEYEAGHTVWLTITNSSGDVKATTELLTGEQPQGGIGFGWYPIPCSFGPGDWVHGAVSTGYTATVEIGLITGAVDVEADSITGTLSAAWLMPGPVEIECERWGDASGAPHKYDTVIPDGHDSYACAWDPDTEWDVQSGDHILVSYLEPAGHHVSAGLFRGYGYDLVMRINPVHNWVHGDYEVGHTVWLTLTNSSGDVKDVAELITAEQDWGATGFNWNPQSSMQPGDWVHGATSTGHTASVQIGLITGSVDGDADTITGTVSAAWLMPGPVDVRCEPWGAPGWAPNKQDSVTPDGSDTYACAWDPDNEWDVQPEQDIAVSYREPDGHQIYGVFHLPILIPLAEYEALVALYNSTNGPNWTTPWMLPTDEPCRLHGVTCQDGHVTEIGLSRNQLSGPLPPEIGNLTALTTLRLGTNSITGPIPPELENMPALRHLWLDNNPLRGEVPATLTPLPLQTFTFNGTDWCVPPTGAVPAWLSGIPGLYGTGFICGLGLGSLSGSVTHTDSTPIADVQVSLYRSTGYGPQFLNMAQTSAEGTYQFTGLGQGLGIDYRVQFADPSHQLAPQYYDNKPFIGTATAIAITPGVPRTGIDAVLDLPKPPSVDVDPGSGSVVYGGDGTAEISMPAPNPSDITVTRTVTCTVGAPTAVTLLLSTGQAYPMNNAGGDLYAATIPAADLSDGATISVAAACSGATTTTTVGHITLYDPSGTITDAYTGRPVAGATVTLYHVPGWESRTGPDDTRPNTCESNLSKPPGAPWSQSAPTELGLLANADVTPIAPNLPFQQTTVEGYYGWDVSAGCWYVTVAAEGYKPLVSPVVGVPPEVTDLNLRLIPAAVRIYLPLVLRQ